MKTPETSPDAPIENLAIGKVIEVDGTHIVAELDARITELSRIHAGEAYAIGQFGSIIRIHSGRRMVYGYVSRLRMKAEYEQSLGQVVQATAPDARVIEADLFGEGEWLYQTDGSRGWRLSFERGVVTFPLPQQVVYLTPRSELRALYGQGSESTIVLGEHVGSGGALCHADLNELFGKHVAVLGSTGSGKSGTVAAVLRAIVDRGTSTGRKSWAPRILVLDPHNEYASAFPEHRRLSTDEGTLSLPYWLLNLQETIALLIGKTEFVATSQANVVKTALMEARAVGAPVAGLAGGGWTVDSPVPYKLLDFKSSVDRQRPPGRNKQEQGPFDSVIQKLEVLERDSRMAFMMREWDGAADPLPTILAQLVGPGAAMRIIDLSGVPNEVAGTASAAIARTLFLLKVWQTRAEREADPVLLVCEEAHRYVPNRGEAQYEAAQEAIRRIAKEGRKYGIGVMLVSQRPSEVEATVLSQCNSWIVLRITNDADKEFVRGMLPDSLSGLSKVLSGLRRREAIFVGQAALLPSRVLVRKLEQAQLPRSHDVDFDAGWQSPPMEVAELADVARRWRLQKRE